MTNLQWRTDYLFISIWDICASFERLCNLYVDQHTSSMQDNSQWQKHSDKFGPGTGMSYLPRLPHFSAYEASPAARLGTVSSQTMEAATAEAGGKRWKRMKLGWSFFFSLQFPRNLQVQDLRLSIFQRKNYPGKETRSSRIIWGLENVKIHCKVCTFQFCGKQIWPKSIWIYLNLQYLYSSSFTQIQFPCGLDPGEFKRFRYYLPESILMFWCHKFGEFTGIKLPVFDFSSKASVRNFVLQTRFRISINKGAACTQVPFQLFLLWEWWIVKGVRILNQHGWFCQ